MHGTHRGVGDPRLQVHLDQYVFRHNRRRTPMAAFQTLLAARGDRCCTSASARVRPTPSAARCASSTSSSRARRAGATGELLITDAGFWNKKVFARLRERGCRSSIGTTMHPVVRAAIDKIPDHAWEPVVDYPDTAICQLAETTLGDQRLIIRRVRVHDAGPHGALSAYWQHFAFVTNRSEHMQTRACGSIAWALTLVGAHLAPRRAGRERGS